MDSFTDPNPTDQLNSATVPHAQQHSNLNDAVAALEAKVGINGSAITSSLDYKITHLFSDGATQALGTGTGYQLGTASGQKLGFLGATPVAQQANSVDLGAVLSNFGLRASGGNPPLNLGSGNITAGTVTASLTGNVTGNCSGSSGSCTGNAATASAVAASALTGTTLAAGVTASSLTSLGTLTGLTVSGATTLSAGSQCVLGTAANPADANADFIYTPTGAGKYFVFDATSTQPFIVRQLGGTAGTDEFRIYHDGSNTILKSQTGNIYFNGLSAVGWADASSGMFSRGQFGMYDAGAAGGDGITSTLSTFGGGGYIGLNNVGVVVWRNNAVLTAGVYDSGISRLGPASLAIGTNAQGDFSGSLKLTTLNIASGGSTTISTGIGSIKMSTANPATNTTWIPFQYAGSTVYVPAWATNSP